MSKIQRVTGTALASAALVSLAACGGSSGSTKSTAAGASASTTKASSSSPSSTSADGSSGTSTVGQEVSAKTLAEKQKAAIGSSNSANIAMVDSTGKFDGHGQVRYTANGGTDMKMTMKVTLAGQSKTMDEILVNKKLYMSANGQWYSFDNSSTASSGLDLNKLTDPASSSSASTDQKWKVVKSDSSGTTYEMTVTASQASSAASQVNNSAATSLAGKKFTVSLDPQGRPSKMTIPSGASGTMTITYNDWGTPVSISAPANAKSMSSLGG